MIQSSISLACVEILDQLERIVANISAEDFCRPLRTLAGATIGQHFRHTVEFFMCLESGFHEGVINYDKRTHDKRIETDKFMAISSIARVRDFVAVTADDKILELEVCYDPQAETFCAIPTNYLRELAYNIEHAIHHMAIMKIGLLEADPHFKMPDNVGVAPSTIRHRKSLSQNLPSPAGTALW